MPYPKKYQNMPIPGAFVRTSRFTEHIDLDMSKSHQNDTPKLILHDQPVETTENRSSPRTSFDDFVPAEKMSTWGKEDDKVAEKKRKSSLRTRAREKVEGLVGKKKGYGKV